MGKLHYRDAPSEKQKKSFAKFLAEDEELILVTSLSQAYIRSCFATTLIIPGGIFMLLGMGLAYQQRFNLGYGLLAGLIVAAFLAAIRTLIVYHGNRYLLTTRRVIIKKGFFAVKLTAALYDKITHIEVDQSFFDKVFLHHGTIIVNTAGMSKDEIVLSHVDHPIEFKNLLERLINREREQFGMRTGPVTTVEGEIIS